MTTLKRLDERTLITDNMIRPPAGCHYFALGVLFAAIQQARLLRAKMVGGEPLVEIRNQDGHEVIYNRFFEMVGEGWFSIRHHRTHVLLELDGFASPDDKHHVINHADACTFCRMFGLTLRNQTSKKPKPAPTPADGVAAGETTGKPHLTLADESNVRNIAELDVINALRSIADRLESGDLTGDTATLVIYPHVFHIGTVGLDRGAEKAVFDLEFAKARLIREAVAFYD